MAQGEIKNKFLPKQPLPPRTRRLMEETIMSEHVKRDVRAEAYAVLFPDGDNGRDQASGCVGQYLELCDEYNARVSKLWGYLYNQWRGYSQKEDGPSKAMDLVEFVLVTRKEPRKDDEEELANKFQAGPTLVGPLCEELLYPEEGEQESCAECEVLSRMSSCWRGFGEEGELVSCAECEGTGVCSECSAGDCTHCDGKGKRQP